MILEGTGLYQDGHSARQYTCQVLLAEGKLHLYFDEGRSNFLIWPIAELDSIHLNGKSLTLKYGAFPHQSLVCEGELAISIQKVWAAKRIDRNTISLQHRSPARFVFFLILFFIFLILAGWFVFLPWVAEKAAQSIPKDMEISLGEQLARAYRPAEALKNDSINHLLQAFADKLNLSADYAITAEVISSEEINAFALPGGRIFVYSGIIKGMNSYEELVALLGHEVTHVEHRHSLKSICRSAASSLVIAAVFGDVTGISSGIVSQADRFKELDYSRELETDADTYGLELMTKNKVSGSGMLGLLGLLKREGQSAPELMKYLSTHPDTEARIENISARRESALEFSQRPELQNLFERLQKALRDT